MCRILTSGYEKCEVNHRLCDDEYVKYLDYYELEDSEHNYKCFVIWKGLGMSMDNER